MESKKFKPMECPVCHEYYFADDTDLEKEDLDYKDKQSDYCMHCGWKYDLYQYEHPEVGDLTNELSLNDYKKWFEGKVLENPDSIIQTIIIFRNLTNAQYVENMNLKMYLLLMFAHIVDGRMMN